MELQKYFPKFLHRQRTPTLSEADRQLKLNIENLIGCKIESIHAYKEAFTLKTQQKTPPQNNYERLEFLGDAILGSIISCRLFRSYPEANEGFLTQMKSKIVNRKNLNKIGESLGLKEFIINAGTSTMGDNLSGNLLEALIGAIYMDLGYEACQNIVLQKLLPNEEISRLEHKVVSYKSLLLEWGQKKKISLSYETCEEMQVGKNTVFRCHIRVGGTRLANATETSKKKAEEKAAQRAFYVLNKKENILEVPKTLS